MSDSENYLLFPRSDRASSCGRFTLWGAITLLFGTANSPPGRLIALFPGATEATWATAKSVVFLCGFLVAILPIARDLRPYIRRNRRELFHSLLAAGIIFAALCLLVFPVSRQANGTFDFERGLAEFYSNMSSHPFSENSEYFYRRILMPACAYYLRLQGNPRYELCALGFAFFMVLALVHFLRARTNYELLPEGNLRRGFLTVLSLATCGFVIVGVQWPGYPEQLGFLLLLLPAFVPMRADARLACLGLALLAHDGFVFPLIPIILFCFPKEEKLPALGLVALYLFIFAVSYGFRFTSALALHDTLGPQSYFHDYFDHPLVVLLGIFSAFKFFWVIYFIVLVRLLRQGRYQLSLALTGLMFSFVPMLFLAWDVTRLVNFSFLAILLSVVVVCRESEPATLFRSRALPLLAALSLAMPSYNIALWWLHHGGPEKNGRRQVFREPGLYQLVSNYLPFTLPVGQPSD